MIICIVNNVEKIQIFKASQSQFIHLNDLYVLNGSYVNFKKLWSSM